MATFGQKHLVKCRCVLPQLKNLNDPEKRQHRFLVFSEIVDDVVKQKYAQCNNCGLIHKVIDICSSEIMQGKEAMSTITTIDDLRLGLNANLSSILDRHQCDLPTWEQTSYIMENKLWGDIVILSNEVEGNNKIIKFIRILGETLFKVDSYTRTEVVGD